LARIINQNKDVIVISKEDENKATVSKTSLFVGIALALVAVAVLIILIVLLTKKDSNNNNTVKTPLLQYVDNYKGSSKGGNKIQLLQGGDVKYILEDYKGECYILIYDVEWMSKYDKKSNAYKSFEIVDSYLTGSKRSDGKDPIKDPLLPAIENCGKDVRFFVVDFNSIEKREQDLQKDPVYFTMSNGTAFSNLKAPMFFHYDNSKTYDSMYDKDNGLFLADGSVDKDGKANYTPAYWGSIIIGQVNYINKLDNEE